VIWPNCKERLFRFRTMKEKKEAKENSGTMHARGVDEHECRCLSEAYDWSGGRLPSDEEKRERKAWGGKKGGHVRSSGA